MLVPLKGVLSHCANHPSSMSPKGQTRVRTTLANLIERHLKLIREAVIDHIVQRYELLSHTKDPDTILNGTESILNDGFTRMIDEMCPQLMTAFRRGYKSVSRKPARGS
jgi:hypothetical protein